MPKQDDLYTYRAQVLTVHDGDTIDALLDLGMDTSRRIKRVRLNGIDCPELATVTPDGRHLGVEARDYLLSLLARGQVLMRTHRGHEYEKYGGLLADVYVVLPDGSELHVNAAMLAAGHGCAYHGERKSLDQHTGLPKED